MTNSNEPYDAAAVHNALRDLEAGPAPPPTQSYIAPEPPDRKARVEEALRAVEAGQGPPNGGSRAAGSMGLSDAVASVTRDILVLMAAQRVCKRYEGQLDDAEADAYKDGADYAERAPLVTRAARMMAAAAYLEPVRLILQERQAELMREAGTERLLADVLAEGEA